MEIEPVIDLDNPQSKNLCYDKRDFAARKKDDEDFERFAEMIRPIFLRMWLTDMLKMNPYAKYMKDIVTNKKKDTGSWNFHHAC